jgi:hypothetical protein
MTNAAILASAGSNENSTTNTHIGYQALLSNTTNGNTAVGLQAGYTNTSGTLTAVGYQAGYSNTTGTGGTFVGNNAGLSNTTATNNTGVGQNALRGVTTGSFNTGVGLNVMYGGPNITGTSNTMMGTSDTNYDSPGRYLTTGTYNVAVGNGALTNNTTGGYNIGIGSAALLSSTTSTYNVAIGHTAGYSTSTGVQNTYVGVAAGSSGNGSYNVALGFQALQTGSSPNYSLALGYNAGYQSTGTGNTFVGPFTGGGQACGFYMTSGNKNTILGGFNGNSYSFDIRTASNYVVLSDGDGVPVKVIANPTYSATEYSSTGSLCTSVVRMQTSWSSSSATNILTVSNLANNNYTFIKLRILVVHAVNNDAAEINVVHGYGRSGGNSPVWTFGTPTVTGLNGYSTGGTWSNSGGTLIWTPGFSGSYYRASFFIDTVSMDGATVTYLL